MDNQVLLKWDDNLLTNIKAIDDQHKHFVSILNDLYVHFSNLSPQEILDKTISELVSYASVHFTTEEGYMEKYNFSGVEEHKQIHNELRSKLEELLNNYNKIGKDALPQLFDFLENWLVQHLDLYDRKYAEYFASIGVKE